MCLPCRNPLVLVASCLILLTVEASQRSLASRSGKALADPTDSELHELHEREHEHEQVAEKIGEKMLNLLEELDPHHCGPREFQCRDKMQCIDDWARCDGNYDCNDLSDEDEDECGNYTCHKGLLKCANQLQCIAEEWMCDLYVDCRDGSDEGQKTCEEQECPPGLIKCDGNVQCYERKWTCDGVLDCASGSDEKNCHAYECEEGWQKCADGKQCINSSWICDGKQYCSDGSDEKLCTAELEIQKELNWSLCLFGVSLPCDNGLHCYLEKLQCDGREACSDGSDEWNCEEYKCPSEMVKCMDGKQCIYLEWLCDGEVQCHDGSDEAFCDLAGSSTETTDEASSSMDDYIDFVGSTR